MHDHYNLHHTVPQLTPSDTVDSARGLKLRDAAVEALVEDLAEDAPVPGRWDSAVSGLNVDAEVLGLSEAAVSGLADPGRDPGRGDGQGERDRARDAASDLILSNGSSSSSFFSAVEGRRDEAEESDNRVLERETAAERNFSKGSSSCIVDLMSIEKKLYTNFLIRAKID